MYVDKVCKTKVEEAISYLYYLSGGDNIEDFDLVLWLFEGIEYLTKGVKKLNLTFIKTENGIKAEEVSYGDFITEIPYTTRFKDLTMEEVELISKLYVMVLKEKKQLLSKIKNAPYWVKMDIGSYINPIFVIDLLIKRKSLTEEGIAKEKEKFEKYETENQNIYLDEVKKDLEVLRNELYHS